MTEQRYTIDDVGGIHHAELVLVPGVNVLCGVNGAGKTSAFKAITRAEGAEVDLEPRDGAGMGTVSRGDEIVLKVGRTVRTSKDAATAALGISDTTPISTLIDPQIKDETAAAKASLRALVQVLRLKVDDAAIAALCNGDEQVIRLATAAIAEDFTEDLMAAAERVKREIEKLAREQEEEAEKATGVAEAAERRVATLLEAIGGKENLHEGDVEAASAAVAEAGREHERAQASRAARERMEARQKELRATIGAKPDLLAAQNAAAAAEDRLHAAEEAMAAARVAYAEATAARNQAIDALKAAEDGARRWQEAQEVLAQAVTGATQQEVDRAAEKVTAAIVTLDLARKSADYREAATERAEATERVGIATREATRFRNLAAGIPHHLGELLAKAGAPGLTVVNGRIHVETPRGLMDFYKRQSEGQRTRKALEVAMHMQGKGTIVPFGPLVYATLDPEARAELARSAAEFGLYVLTEQPTDGPLRVEHETGAATDPAPGGGDTKDTGPSAPVTSDQEALFD